MGVLLNEVSNCFVGISMVLPLQNAMKKPRDFHKPSGVLNTGMVVVTSLFLVIGFFGYLKYGDQIESSISLNLPSEEKLAQAVKILFAIGVLLGFALQFFIAIQIMWPPLVQRFQWKTNLFMGELLFRTLMVFVTCKYNRLFRWWPGSDIYLFSLPCSLRGHHYSQPGHPYLVDWRVRFDVPGARLSHPHPTDCAQREGVADRPLDVDTECAHPAPGCPGLFPGHLREYCAHRANLFE